jgi:hypothetical protein
MKKHFIIFCPLIFLYFSSQAFYSYFSDTDSIIPKQTENAGDDHYYKPSKISSTNGEKKSRRKPFREHQGFHLEFNIGPAFGKITQRLPNTTGYDEYDFTGPGVGIDFKIGGAVSKNFCLTFDMLSKDILAPDVDKNGHSYIRASRNSLGEVTYGAGFTYFFKTDLFLSATTGIGVFAIDDSTGTERTDGGFSMQLRAGKHWWISQNWGISVAGAYGFTSVNNLSDTLGVYDHDIKSDRFTIMAGIVFR